MQVINDVLSMSAWPVPPFRDIDGDATRMKMRRVPGMHLMTSDTANPPDGAAADETSYLPAPEQPCLVKMTEMELAEMIEHTSTTSTGATVRFIYRPNSSATTCGATMAFCRSL